MGQAPAITNIVLTSIALILYIASFATPWYVIEPQLLNKINFKWNGATYNEFMGGVTERYDYTSLKSTFTTTGALLGISLASAFFNLICLITHLSNSKNTRKSLVNVSRLFSWMAVTFAVICIIFFPISFTDNIQKEPFCPYGKSSGYYCSSFSGSGSPTDSNGFSSFGSYGGGPGYYLVIPIIVLELIVVGFSFALRPHSCHHADVANTIVHPRATLSLTKVQQQPVVGGLSPVVAPGGGVYVQSSPATYGYQQPPPQQYAYPPQYGQPYAQPGQPYIPQPPQQQYAYPPQPQYAYPPPPQQQAPAGYTHSPPPPSNSNTIGIDSSIDPNNLKDC
ncbi:hypothetical protein DFA_02301 [Cavenderia fasciculata]|uniref:Transmembrane protein n=1 Tax=Cavenderia fasciculata TaxID=261658 RepID=F4PZ28_CACFS|nr:uncharacterized protein DFA_02301 [Cavenderia fasciculata]EGG19057.1 hypothetical protein DFA_02301 [Cavenderia fasciculata]|eukprot:XP_004366690.1 hypothetical protein DFA_02301 [Cavenderia fasciculata]